MNILIPNATSPKNVGDLAILTAMKSLLSQKDNLIIHSSEAGLYKNYFKERTSPTLYSWVAFEDHAPISRVMRLVKLLLSYHFFNSKKLMSNDKTLDLLIEDYKKADLILFAGGGYLRSQKGLTQSVNLLMTLVHFYFAKKTKARKIIAPISFGPFAHKWQEKLAGLVLHGFDLVAVREKYSYDLLKQYTRHNLIKSSDTALFLPAHIHRKSTDKNFVLGFTIRKWLEPAQQKFFEESFTQSIIEFAKKSNAIVQPIVQVDAPEYGDRDFELTKQIIDLLKKSQVKTRRIKKVIDLENSAAVYGQIDLLLGMRMHSNILAAVFGTPFVAIAYEHKTVGISRDLGLKTYCIKVEDADKKIILNKLVLALNNIGDLRIKIVNNLKILRLKEINRWKQILKN